MIYFSLVLKYETPAPYTVTFMNARCSRVFTTVQDAWLPQHVSRHDGLRPTLWPSHEQHAWNDEHSRWITLSNGAKHGQ